MTDNDSDSNKYDNSSNSKQMSVMTLTTAENYNLGQTKGVLCSVRCVCRL